MDFINRSLGDEYNSGLVFDRVYAGNTFTIEGAGPPDMELDYKVPGMELREPLNFVALRTVGLGDIDSSPTYPPADWSLGDSINSFADSLLSSFNTQAVAPAVTNLKNKLTADTARFLYLNQVLQNMMNDNKVVTTDKAVLQGLWTQQLYLEGILPNQVVLLNNMFAVDYPTANGVNDTINLTTFIGQMEYQISQVNSLASKYGYGTMLPIAMTPMMIAGIGFAAWLLLSGKLSKIF